MLGIIEGGTVSFDLAQAEARWSRALDAWEAITWTVVRDPLCGEPLTESGRTRAYSFDGARSVDMPSIDIVYEVADRHIVVHQVEFREASYGQAGRA